MASKTKSAFADKKMLGRAIKDSFIKLNPKTQVQNPVMLLVYISAILTTGLWIVSLFGLKDASSGYTLAIAIILWFTCIFANFAEAIAEGRGKAQADALKEAAKNPGMAGATMGAGLGFGMGNMFGNMMRENKDSSAAETVVCAGCGARIPASAKFCPECGKAAGAVCPKCGKPVKAGAKFCPECGQKLESVCPKCGKPVKAGAKFCPECGEKL